MAEETKVVFTGVARGEDEDFQAYKIRRWEDQQKAKIKAHPNNNMFWNSFELGNYVNVPKQQRKKEKRNGN